MKSFGFGKLQTLEHHCELELGEIFACYYLYVLSECKSFLAKTFK